MAFTKEDSDLLLSLGETKESLQEWEQLGAERVVVALGRSIRLLNAVPPLREDVDNLLQRVAALEAKAAHLEKIHGIDEGL